jgi:Intracellular proteinase inhibitor
MGPYWLWSAGLLWVTLIVGYTPKDGMGSEVPALAFGLEVPAGVRVGTPVPLKVTLQNTSNRPIALTLGGRPAHDFVVTTPDGQEVWRWSHGEAIQAILELKPLKPGETLQFTAAWGQRDNGGRPVPAGMYWVRGVLNLEPPERLETAPKSLSISP